MSELRFTELPVSGAFRIEPTLHADDRGSFARAWCRREFSRAGIEVEFVQANTARTREAGTIRGLHFQAPPHSEAKLFRCTGGAIYDVIVDVRPGSDTYGEWTGVELDPGEAAQVFVPAGCAHGYQTLEDGSEVFYLVSAYYAPEAERGIRYDDPTFGIEWPRAPTVVSDKDRSWPPFTGADAGSAGGDAP